jgi:hypothetical protein
MSRPRIFISHSATGDPVAEELRDALYEDLEADYDVLVDSERLQAGDAWRPRINLWIGHCDAAIVLVSDKVLNQSHFVRYEVNVLAYRAAMSAETDAPFLLIPVFLPGVSYNSIPQSWMGPSDLESFTAVFASPDNISGAVEAIQDRLSGLTQSQTPVDPAAKSLQSMLDSVSAVVLEDVASCLGVDLGPWTPENDVQLELALKLLAVGVGPESTDALQMLGDYVSDPMRFVENAMDLIGSSWIDLKSLEEFPQSPEPESSVALNGDHPTTALLYVFRACNYHKRRLRRSAWRCAIVDDVVGELSDPSVLVQKVRTALIRCLGKTENEMGEDDLRTYLTQMQVHDPLYVALPFASLPLDVLQPLRDAFPTVTFFLLTGSHPLTDTTLNQWEIQRLNPELEEEDESRYVVEYETYRGHVLLYS